jgi:hypothetical protein
LQPYKSGLSAQFNKRTTGQEIASRAFPALPKKGD